MVWLKNSLHFLKKLDCFSRLNTWQKILLTDVDNRLMAVHPHKDLNLNTNIHFIGIKFGNKLLDRNG